MLMGNKNSANLTYDEKKIINFYVCIEDFILKISSYTYLFFSFRKIKSSWLFFYVQFISNAKIEIVLFSGYRNTRNRQEWSVIKKTWTRFSQNNFSQKTFAIYEGTSCIKEQKLYALLKNRYSLPAKGMIYDFDCSVSLNTMAHIENSSHCSIIFFFPFLFNDI